MLSEELKKKLIEIRNIEDKRIKEFYEKRASATSSTNLGIRAVIDHVLKTGDINSPKYPYRTLIEEVIYYDKKYNVVELLLENGANPNVTGVLCRVPLLIASENNYINLIEPLIKHGAFINIQEEYSKKTPLYYATDKDHTEVAKILIKNGADPNIENESGYTPLFGCVYKENLELIRLLLASGADINHQNMYGTTALETAVFMYNLKRENIENLKTLECLLLNGINPNIQDLKGNVAISSSRKLSVIKMLINYGADINIKNNKGQNVIEVLKEKSVSEEIIKYLQNISQNNIEESIGKSMADAKKSLKRIKWM